MVANLIKVKVDPKELKAIPDVLPYRALLEGEAVELELTKKEILRCMNFADVYDLTSGEEVLIDEIAFKAIEEYVEEATEDEGTEVPEQGTEEPETPPSDEGNEEETPA